MSADAHLAPDSRWATLECYGTLVDWNAGIQAELARLFSAEHAARLLMRYHEPELSVQRENVRACYRDVMAAVPAELASGTGRELAPEAEDAVGRALHMRVAQSHFHNIVPWMRQGSVSPRC